MVPGMMVSGVLAACIQSLPPLQDGAPKEGQLHSIAKGTGAPVVLIPGSPGSVRDFQQGGLFDLLAATYQVVAVDPPGFGESNVEPALTLAASAQSIHEHLSSYHLDRRPLLVGYSWGGAVAIAYALLHPLELRGLILFSPVVVPDPTLAEEPTNLEDLGIPPLLGFLKNGLMLNLACLTTIEHEFNGEKVLLVNIPHEVKLEGSYNGSIGSVQISIGSYSLRSSGTVGIDIAQFRRISSKIIEKRLAQVFLPNTVPEAYLEYARDQWSDPRVVRSMAMDTVKLLAGDLKNQSERLSELTVPILVLYGVADTYVDPGKHAHALGKLPSAKVVGIDGAGHAFHMFLAKRVSQELTRFDKCLSPTYSR